MSSEQPREPTEEELLAAYEAQVKRLRVDDVIVQTIVSLLNLAGRKAGLAPGTEDERDIAQVQSAIDAVRALLPLAEPALGPDLASVREALSQLQVAYSKIVAEGDAPAPAVDQPPGDEVAEGPGPAQQSGRLWVPGQ